MTFDAPQVRVQRAAKSGGAVKDEKATDSNAKKKTGIEKLDKEGRGGQQN